MLPPGEHHRQELVATPPGYDVHHGLRLVVAPGQGRIELTEQLFAHFCRVTADEQGRVGAFADDGDVVVVGQPDHCRQLS